MQALNALFRRLCWGLVALLALHTSAHAGLLGPEAVLSSEAPSLAQLERAKVQQFLEGAALQDRMKALGVDGLQAAQRVKAMTDAEVHQLAQKIDALPAGGALTDREIILVLLVALLLIVL